MKQQAWQGCEEDCDSALNLNQANLKALMRRAEARVALGKLDAATRDITVLEGKGYALAELTQKIAAKKAAKGGLFGKKKVAPDDDDKAWSKPKKKKGDGSDDEDFEFDRSALDHGVTDAVEVEWSTSSSDEDDETRVMYDTRVDRHACQLMLGEMQRRRPRGLVFHHTQPIREASPPPGTGRGAEMAAAALKKEIGRASCRERV